MLYIRGKTKLHCKYTIQGIYEYGFAIDYGWISKVLLRVYDINLIIAKVKYKFNTAEYAEYAEYTPILVLLNWSEYSVLNSILKWNYFEIFKETAAMTKRWKQ